MLVAPGKNQGGRGRTETRDGTRRERQRDEGVGGKAATGRGWEFKASRVCFVMSDNRPEAGGVCNTFEENTTTIAWEGRRRRTHTNSLHPS